MRYLITGVDAAGRSCVVEQREIRDPKRDVDVWSMFRTSVDPARPRPLGNGKPLDFGVGPGDLNWVMSRWAPGAEEPLTHHTDTMDLNVVLAGSMELLLDDGPHQLAAGDCVAVLGVDHAWRAGPEGCTISLVIIGTPPPTEEPAAGAGR